MIDDPFRWQLQHLATSRAYRKKLALIKANRSHRPQPNVVTVNLPVLLGAILLIEMHQRPGVIRAAEWIISTAVPRFLRRPITRGPLQIADGPWDLESAIRFGNSVLAQAVDGALNEEAAIESAAVAWNGKAVRQPCSAYGYGDVLRCAYVIVGRALADPVCAWE